MLSGQRSRTDDVCPEIRFGYDGDRGHHQHRFRSDNGRLGSGQLSAFFRARQLLRLQTRLLTSTFADRSKYAPDGALTAVLNVLLNED